MFIKTKDRLINTDHIKMLFISEHTSKKAEEYHDGYTIQAALDNSAPAGINVNFDYFFGEYDNENLVKRVFEALIYEIGKVKNGCVIDFDEISEKEKRNFDRLTHSDMRTYLQMKAKQEGGENI